MKEYFKIGPEVKYHNIYDRRDERLNFSPIRPAYQISGKLFSDITHRLEKLKTNYNAERTASPDPAKLTINEIETLKAFLYGTAIPGKVSSSRKDFIFNYVAEYILRGKQKIIKQSPFGGSFEVRHRDWIIDAEAKYRFLKYLESPRSEETRIKKKFSIPAYAMALNLKNIPISKDGIGLRDGIDYPKKFGLKPGATLYNRSNDIVNQKIANVERLKIAALQIIKENNL